MTLAREMKWLGGAVAGLALLVLPACQPAETPEPVADYSFVHEVSDLPADPAIRYGELENGMRYAILANQTPPNTAAVRLVFNVGSLAEAEDQRGLAHFIEHMAFNGSTEVPEGEMVPLLERFGLQFGPDTNAFTGRDTVGYQLDIPEVDPETVDTALFLMRQTASELLMDPEAIDRERGVILSEERFRNTPIRRWNNALWRFRLPETLVADRDAIGTVEVIETAGREQFVDYYENYYVPQRALLVVTGDIDPDTIEAKIREGFASWTSIDDPRGDPDIGTFDPDRPMSVGYFNDPEIYTIFTVDVMQPARAAARYGRGTVPEQSGFAGGSHPVPPICDADQFGQFTADPGVGGPFLRFRAGRPGQRPGRGTAGPVARGRGQRRTGIAPGPGARFHRSRTGRAIGQYAHLAARCRRPGRNPDQCRPVRPDLVELAPGPGYDDAGLHARAFRGLAGPGHGGGGQCRLP